MSRRLTSSRQALARFLRVLPVLAVRAARLLPLADCSVQCARQQLFTVHSDAAFGAHVPKLIKAARCVHVLSHGHAVSVTVRSMLCVSFPCAAKLVQLSKRNAQACCVVCVCTLVPVSFNGCGLLHMSSCCAVCCVNVTCYLDTEYAFIAEQKHEKLFERQPSPRGLYMSASRHR